MRCAALNLLINGAVTEVQNDRRLLRCEHEFVAYRTEHPVDMVRLMNHVSAFSFDQDFGCAFDFHLFQLCPTIQTSSSATPLVYKLRVKKS